MNHRDLLLNLTSPNAVSSTVPAGFFMHFDPIYHKGQAAVDKHLEFFHQTGMDFVKIQFELPLPPFPHIRKPKEWAHAPLYPTEFFDTPIGVVEGLVKAAKSEALVIMTLYSPFMWAHHLDPQADLNGHIQEKPEAVSKGLEIMTENVLKLVRGCKRAGVDGFYVSTQGGETFRFGDSPLFSKYIKPTDLAIWDEIRDCTFNILHVCDYEGGYTNLSPFLEYPGQVVNCSMKLGDQALTPKEISEMFNRPFMGGMERKGVITKGGPESIRQAVVDVLKDAPDRFILAADCTVPSETPWENLRTAITMAHEFRLARM